METVVITGVHLNQSVSPDILLCNSDKVIIAKSEDDLQWAVYNLQQITWEFSLKISTHQTKDDIFGENTPCYAKLSYKIYKPAVTSSLHPRASLSYPQAPSWSRGWEWVSSVASGVSLVPEIT